MDAAKAFWKSYKEKFSYMSASSILRIEGPECTELKLTFDFIESSILCRGRVVMEDVKNVQGLCV
jgi:hypothetical protein